MPLNHPLLSIGLPPDVLSKVCVSWENGTSCELVQPIPFVAEPYGLKYFLINKSFEI